MYLPITYDPHKILAYLRQTQDQTALIALNFSKKPVGLILSSQLLSGNWELLISNKRDNLPKVNDRKIILDGYEAMILLQE